MKHAKWLSVCIFFLSLAAILLAHVPAFRALFEASELFLYGAIALLFIFDFFLPLFRTGYKRVYLKRNIVPLILITSFLTLLFLRAFILPGYVRILSDVLPFIAVLYAIFIFLDLPARLKRMDLFLQELFSHPARTILVSFLLVMILGTILLQLPAATVDRLGLPLIDALFTSTSAVCVTGLIVVDTASVFTLFGRLVILALIQIGGLSIIILSFFVIFLLRKRVSLEGKLLISYMLSENDLSSLSRSLKRIIIITLLFEALGAVLLFLRFYPGFQDAPRALLFSVFHAVSAFCNAGFALFTNSLEGYISDPFVCLTVAFLIICGGLSFAVFSNLFERFRGKYRSLFRKQRLFVRKISLNTKIVLGVSGALLITGTLLIYALEHGGALSRLDTGTQYLAAFFQSVTLRTAGFNTIPVGSLGTATLLMMAAFMFIGGASGSTAGGIKVNTFTIILVYIKSAIRKEQKVTLFKHSISKEYVLRGILIVLFGMVSIFFGTFVLSLSEAGSLEQLLFEAVSAFGTVGLSTGVTGSLTVVGKVVIIVLMFVGRTGPLTILAAMGEREQKIQHEYPYGDILIG
jgi:trk system potassium uptake protein TrkH